jgi:DNA-binding MarR family transcriptional regulator
MDPRDAVRSRALLLNSLHLNPKPFKSFFSRFITEHVGCTGLTESQILFLLVLDRMNGASLKEMTEKIGVHKSLTTRAVKHLLDNGFVVNTAESGKEYSIVLTERGADAKNTAIEVLIELFDLIFEDLTDEELAVMERALTKVRRKMEELSSKEHEPGGHCFLKEHFE